MKYLLSILAVAVSLLAGPAMASGVDQTAVVKAVHHHQYQLAASLLTQGLKTDPKNPRLHYELGQVYAIEGQHRSAARELETAQNIDPTLAFARSASDFKARLRHELAFFQPRSSTQSSHHSNIGSALLALFVLMILVGGAAYVLVSRRQAQRDKADHAKRLAGQQKALVDLNNRLDDARIEIQTSSSDQKDTMLSEADTLGAKISAGLASTKRDEILPSSHLRYIDEEISTLTAWARTGVKPTAPVHATAPRSAETSGPTYTTQPSRHYHRDAPQPAAQPIVVNNNQGGNGSGFFEGMLMGELMSGPRETIIENDPGFSMSRRDSEFDMGVSDPASFDPGYADTAFDSGSSDSGFDIGSDDSGFDSGFDDDNLL